MSVGETARKNVGVKSFLQGYRKIVREIYLLPVGVFIESVCSADSGIIFSESILVKCLKIIFKLKKPVFIKIQFFSFRVPSSKMFDPIIFYHRPASNST